MESTCSVDTPHTGSSYSCKMFKIVIQKSVYVCVTAKCGAIILIYTCGYGVLFVSKFIIGRHLEKVWGFMKVVGIYVKQKTLI